MFESDHQVANGRSRAMAGPELRTRADTRKSGFPD
jgi:hypothetical protein